MRVQGIDVLRVFAFYWVVLIHTRAVGLFGGAEISAYVLDQAARFAVPCFFLISGYLWKSDQISDPAASSRATISKIIPKFVVWAGIYALLEFSGIYEREFGAKFSVYFASVFTGGPGYHLWYLPALVVGSILCWIALGILSFRGAATVIVALYLCGIALGSYNSFWGAYLPPVFYRNGIFEAPIFLLAGHAIREGRLVFTVRSAAILAATGLAMHLLEGVLAGHFPRAHEYSFGTLPFAIGVFGLFLKVRAKDCGWGQYVFGAYLIHLFFVRIIGEYLPHDGTTIALVTVMVAGSLSLAAAYFLSRSPARWLVMP